MNISEYKLIVSLINKVKEPVIAIEIANDALALGKSINTLENNISELEKQISNNQNRIKNMIHEWSNNLDEDSDLIETKIFLEHKITRDKQKLQNYMKKYEFIMGIPYNIDYLINKIVDNAIKDALQILENRKYDKTNKFFNDNEEQESLVIYTTIQELLNECKNARTQITKFTIATSIMCVISNSPVYVNSNKKLKKAVLLKMDELISSINTFSGDKTEYYNYTEKIRNF